MCPRFRAFAGHSKRTPDRKTPAWHRWPRTEDRQLRVTSRVGGIPVEVHSSEVSHHERPSCSGEVPESRHGRLRSHRARPCRSLEWRQPVRMCAWFRNRDGTLVAPFSSVGPIRAGAHDLSDSAPDRVVASPIRRVPTNRKRAGGVARTVRTPEAAARRRGDRLEPHLSGELQDGRAWLPAGSRPDRGTSCERVRHEA